jgi:hypothetical protein
MEIPKPHASIFFSGNITSTILASASNCCFHHPHQKFEIISIIFYKLLLVFEIPTWHRPRWLETPPSAKLSFFKWIIVFLSNHSYHWIIISTKCKKQSLRSAPIRTRSDSSKYLSDNASVSICRASQISALTGMFVPGKRIYLISPHSPFVLLILP